MAYDETIAARIREALAPEFDVVEKKMFGGLAFLVAGHMAIAASGQGGLLVRCDPDDSEALVAEDGVDRMVMRERPMDGWLRVDPDASATDDALRRWVDTGVGYARSLPPK